MRAIGTIPNEQDARRLGSYLFVLGISSQMDPSNEGFCVWIRDEDKVERARQELAAFLQNPTDSRYDEAERAANQLLQQRLQAEKQYRKNFQEVRSRWERINPRRCPLTLALIAASILVAIFSKLGDDRGPFLNYLLITPLLKEQGRQFDGLVLPEIRSGQVWRLITPIFIHFGLPHIIFNMWALRDLGSIIEIRRGTWRLALLVLVTAVLSNLAQYLWHGTGFGGMSGVLYGLFGYAWMKSRYDSSVGIYLNRDSVVMMVAWLFLCMTGWVGPIANAAHLAGMAVGVVIGVMPVLWRKIR